MSPDAWIALGKRLLKAVLVLGADRCGELIAAVTRSTELSRNGPARDQIVLRQRALVSKR